MNQKGILFNGEMVRAILAGRKTQTRRPVANCPVAEGFTIQSHEDGWWLYYQREEDMRLRSLKPSYAIGDLLYIRETWQVYTVLWANDAGNMELGEPLLTIPEEARVLSQILYRADHSEDFGPWRPPIHMPRWAARPERLLVTDVRAQRLRDDITMADAKAEGVQPIMRDSGGTTPWGEWIEVPDYFSAFRDAWDAIYAKRGLGWDANPWVWAYTFELQRSRREEPTNEPSTE